jgi:hypothetical protein
MKTGQFLVFMVAILLMAPISSGDLETSWDKTGCVSISGYDSIGQINNVTLNVDNSDILFIGYDVWQRIEQYSSGLMDNETVVDLMQHHEDELLFIMPCPRRDYISVVGMNESFYIELLIKCMYEDNVIVQVTSLEVMSGSDYIDSLKTALSTAMDENATRGLNMTAWDRCGHAGSSPLRAHLWSYTYTGGSLTFGSSPHRVVLWSSPDASDLLQEMHWEIVTEANISQVVSREEPDPSTWEHGEIPTQIVMSITLDGELIQVLHEALFIAADYDLTIYLLGGLIGTAAIVVIVAVVWHHKNVHEL